MLFLDSDVILDYLLNREPFVRGMYKIMSSKQKLGTTVFVMSNVLYFLQRLKGKQDAIEELKTLRSIITEINQNFYDIDEALTSEFRDKEDAFNYYACLRNPEVEGIITRNTKDFIKSQIPVYTPEAYLSYIED